jgi:hypothetical protein
MNAFVRNSGAERFAVGTLKIHPRAASFQPPFFDTEID